MASSEKPSKFDLTDAKPAPLVTADVVVDPNVGKQAIEGWAKAKRSSAVEFAAAKALRAWPVGAEVSESDYDGAVHEAMHGVIR